MEFLSPIEATPRTGPATLVDQSVARQDIYKVDTFGYFVSYMLIF